MSARVGLATCIVSASVAVAHAAAADESPAQAHDRDVHGGLGTQLGFRGIGYDFDSDLTIAANKGMDAVETMQLGAATMLWPSPARASGYWGVWAGAQTALVRFEKAANQSDDTPGGLSMANVEPMIGMVFTGPGDRLRFDVDLAPAISTGQQSTLASQASLFAALSTAPHDDLLYVPNLRSAGRGRMRLQRRWDVGRRFALATVLKVEAGYAETRATYGNALGRTGGVAADVRLFWRTYYPYLEGFIFDLTGDVGYTSVWAGDVVLPTRVGGGVTAAIDRTLEARAGIGWYTPSIALGSLDVSACAITLGARFSFDTSPPTWTQGDVDRQQLEGTPLR